MPRLRTSGNNNAVVQNCLFRGPRVKIGIDEGLAAAELSPATGRKIYRGKFMNRAARISAKAPSGACWCSETVWQAAEEQVSPEFVANLGLMGEHMGSFQLKGVQEEMQLVQCSFARAPLSAFSKMADIHTQKMSVLDTAFHKPPSVPLPPTPLSLNLDSNTQDAHAPDFNRAVSLGREASHSQMEINDAAMPQQRAKSVKKGISHVASRIGMFGAASPSVVQGGSPRKHAGQMSSWDNERISPPLDMQASASRDVLHNPSLYYLAMLHLNATEDDEPLSPSELQHVPRSAKSVHFSSLLDRKNSNPEGCNSSSFYLLG